MTETKFTPEQFKEFKQFFKNFHDNVTVEYGFFIDEVIEKCKNNCRDDENDECIFKEFKYDLCKLNYIQELMYSIEQFSDELIEKINEEGEN